MSQYWHGHWIENQYKPTRLRNWEIPKWYPSWPDRHCVTTKIEVNERGHILDPKKKAPLSPWGNFKGTWDLPRKITRKVAEELAATEPFKKTNWEMHLQKHRNICRKVNKIKKISAKKK